MNWNPFKKKASSRFNPTYQLQDVEHDSDTEEGSLAYHVDIIQFEAAALGIVDGLLAAYDISMAVGNEKVAKYILDEAKAKMEEFRLVKKLDLRGEASWTRIEGRYPHFKKAPQL